jgi:hypothetical protein
MNHEQEARRAADVAWMRDRMGVQRVEHDDPRDGTLRGVGHARSAFAARFGGFVLMVCALIACMVGARPAERVEAAGSRTRVADVVGAGLGTLGVTGFVVGRAIERRTRYEVWLRSEARAIHTSDVEGLLASAGASDRGAAPRLWISGPAVADDARALAQAHGVRCFVREGRERREV